MSLDEREAGLLRLIESHLESQCRELMDAARTEARGMIARAFRAARARLRERVVAERANARARLQAARAERDTRERAGGDRANAQLLVLAWPRLRAELARRWAEPAGRRVWTQGAVAQARTVLPAGVWTLRHAPGWGPDEWRPLASDLGAALGSAPRLVADGSLEAGLTVACGGAVLDASLEGLLKDRTRIEARLLALWAEGKEGSAS